MRLARPERQNDNEALLQCKRETKATGYGGLQTSFDEKEAPDRAKVVERLACIFHRPLKVA